MGQTTEEIIADIRQWSIDKIDEFTDMESPESDHSYYYKNALSIAEEFDEWIREYDNEDYQLDIMCIQRIG